MELDRKNSIDTRKKLANGLLLPNKYPSITVKVFQKEGSTNTDTFYLRFTVLTGVIVMLEGSALSVWTSPAVIKLQSNDSSVNPLGRSITTVEISALLGIPSIVSLVSAGLLPKLADVIGRKKSLQILGLGIFLSTIGLAFCQSVSWMVFFICISSSLTAAGASILPMYITEVCEDRNRATYGCLMTASSPMGQLLCFLIGPAFHFKVFTLLIVTPLIFFLVFSVYIPESPVYCLSKGKKGECKKWLRKLRSNKSDKELEIDYNEIFFNLESLKKTKQFSLWKLLGEKEGRVGITLAMLCILGQYFSGVPIVMSLLAPIFNESGSNLSGNTIAIIVGTVKTLSFTFTSLVIQKTGRRPMLIISAAMAGIPISCLGIFFYLKHLNSPIVHQFQWIPLACILTYIISYSLGLGPIPLSLMSELFSADVRSTGLAFVSTASSLIMSFYIAAYPVLAENIGIYSCMWIFGGSCFVNSVLFTLFLPETKGKGDTEIQKLLKYYKFFK
ncbi:facilitated trehalose transporter Tret1-like [Diabrotica undecimpunctata]|uniref:facilitated trehalose transporter Tret1-like n=1 Tax=Diabrotica undecimpunctata TaxID=50387 RepID=UPI003B6335E7